MTDPIQAAAREIMALLDGDFAANIPLDVEDTERDQIAAIIARRLEPEREKVREFVREVSNEFFPSGSEVLAANCEHPAIRAYVALPEHLK